jgi:hypothetical protein
MNYQRAQQRAAQMRAIRQEKEERRRRAAEQAASPEWQTAVEWLREAKRRGKRN